MNQIQDQLPQSITEHVQESENLAMLRNVIFQSETVYQERVIRTLWMPVYYFEVNDS